jgi:hypothetical protein
VDAEAAAAGFWKQQQKQQQEQQHRVSDCMGKWQQLQQVRIIINNNQSL